MRERAEGRRGDVAAARRQLLRQHGDRGDAAGGGRRRRGDGQLREDVAAARDAARPAGRRQGRW